MLGNDNLFRSMVTVYDGYLSASSPPANGIE
jgi:hypothetical protein